MDGTKELQRRCMCHPISNHSKSVLNEVFGVKVEKCVHGEKSRAAVYNLLTRATVLCKHVHDSEMLRLNGINTSQINGVMPIFGVRSHLEE